MQSKYRIVEDLNNRNTKVIVLVSATVLTVFLCLYRYVFTLNVGIDTDMYVLGMYGPEWVIVSLGRFGMYISTMILNAAHFSPYTNGFWFLILFTSVVLLWIYFFTRITGKVSYYFLVFAVLYITNPLWVFQFYFSLQTAAIAVGLLADAVSVLLLYDFMGEGSKKTLSYVKLAASIACAVYSFGTYQSFPPLHIASVAAILLLAFDRECQNDDEIAHRNLWRRFLFYAIHFFVAIGSYYIICRLLKSGEGFGDNSYLAIGWGDESVDSFDVLVADMRSLLLGKGEYAGFSVLFSILLLAMIWALLLLKRSKGRVLLDYGILFIANIVSGILMNLVIGRAVEPRARFAVIFSAAFMMMFSLMKAHEGTGKNMARILMPLMICVVLLCCLLQINRYTKLVYTMDVCDEQTRMTGADIVHDLRMVAEGEDDTVIIVGAWRAPLNGSCYRCDIVGVSNLEYGYREGNPASGSDTCGLFLNAVFGTDYYFYPTEEQATEAAVAAESMPVYPRDGYVRRVDDIIVVKLSEPY